MVGCLSQLRTGFILASWCVCALALTACTHVGTSGPSHRSTLVVAIPAEPVSLNPLYLQGEIGYVVSELGYSYLTNYDSRGNMIADVALHVPTTGNAGISHDGLHVTYQLRQGVRWQDGTELSSRDVVFTYLAIMNPANTIPSRYGYDQIATVNSPDAHTVVVTLKRPYSPIISYFFGGDSNYPILPAHLLATFANLNHAAYNDLPIGSGPFAFARWSHGDNFSVKANPTYYAGRPAIDHITLRVVHNSSTTIAQLTTHEVDAAFFADVTRIATLRGIRDHRVVVTPVPYFYYLEFNLTDPLVADPAVRRAFALAIDRRALVNKVTHGLYDADTALRALFTWSFDPHADNVRYDPRAAAALLSRSGWIPGPDGIRVKNGHRLELGLALRSGREIDEKFAVLTAAQERLVGIEVAMKRYSSEQFTALDGPINQGRYQVNIRESQAAYDPDASWLLSCSQRAPNGFNGARYCSAPVDRALRAAASSYERVTRLRAYRFVQRKVLADLPYYFLCQTSEIDVIPSGLQGYDPPLLSPFNSVARWRLR